MDISTHITASLTSYYLEVTIGGYESAWLADLCMAYVMDNSRDILDDLIYDGIYRDDGIAVFKGSKMTGKITK